MKIENEFTVAEVKKLMHKSKKSKKTPMDVPNDTEMRARDYLLSDADRANSPTRWGVPGAFYEAMTFQLGGITYTPDWVLMWHRSAYRELIEVKGTAKDWGGYRIRETRAKLEFLAHLVQPFGWRVFLLSVSKNDIKEQEIGVYVHPAPKQGDHRRRRH